MTVEPKIIVRYLDSEDIETIHAILSEAQEKDGEPMPSFSTANPEYIEALVKIPKTSFFGFEQYPTLASKAAIIFYTVNKRHFFLNGNKRMSVACLIIFLLLNKKELTVSQAELTAKAEWLAKTTHPDSVHEIKEHLIKWIESSMKDSVV